MRGKAGYLHNSWWVQSCKVLSPRGNAHMPGPQSQIPGNRYMGPIAERTAWGTSTFLTGFSSGHGGFKNTFAFVSNFETHECVWSHQPACIKDRGIHLIPWPESMWETEYQLPFPMSKCKEKQEGALEEDLETHSQVRPSTGLMKKKILNRSLTNIITGRKTKRREEGRKERKGKEERKPFILKIKWHTSGVMKCEYIHKR